VRWQAEHDKIGYEHTTPLTNAAVEALQEAQQEHAAIGEAWVFPSLKDPTKPVSRHLAPGLVGAGRVYGETQAARRRGWHSLRRKFATELKATPLKDLCELGGWKDPQTVLKCYQRADPVTMRAALENRGRHEA
jgi:integrase